MIAGLDPFVFRRGALAAAMLLGVAAPTTARASVSVSPHAVRAGAVVRVQGSILPGCAGGDQVTVFSPVFGHRHDFAGLPALLLTSRPDGRYSAKAHIRHRLRAGLYQVGARCGGGLAGSTVLRIIR